MSKPTYLLIGGPCHGKLYCVEDGIEHVIVPVRVLGLPTFDESMSLLMQGIHERRVVRRQNVYREVRYSRDEIQIAGGKYTVFIDKSDTTWDATRVAAYVTEALADTQCLSAKDTETPAPDDTELIRRKKAHTEAYWNALKFPFWNQPPIRS